jgi:isopenicillin-N epimerase
MKHNPSLIKSLFLLNPDIVFLNFGSFGACPRPIFEDYQTWQRKLESEPVQFIINKGLEYLKASRESLANYVNCLADEIVFVVNPTYAINTIAKSLDLKEGDEILTTNLEYGATDRTWDFVCSETGAKYIQQPITLPLVSKEIFLHEFFDGVTEKTKLIFISQITSATGLILPVEEVCRIAKEKGILTFVDGAHVPGHIPLDLQKLDVDFYTGACHKWMMTPKGSSFLMAKKSVQSLLKPLVVSWGYKSISPSDSLFLDHHQMSGTRDFSAFLTIPKAIQFMEENNWEQVANSCNELVLANAQRFCDLLGAQPLAPLTKEFFCQLFSIPINTTNPEKLKHMLYDVYKIEIPIAEQNGNYFLRYSIQAFNSQEDLDSLYFALKEIINNTDLICTIS